MNIAIADGVLTIRNGVVCVTSGRMTITDDDLKEMCMASFEEAQAAMADLQQTAIAVLDGMTAIQTRMQELITRQGAASAEELDALVTQIGAVKQPLTDTLSSQTQI
jgi:DNA anti-recombination protein RmuC